VRGCVEHRWLCGEVQAEARVVQTHDRLKACILPWQLKLCTFGSNCVIYAANMQC
jgi:hypothetical protein